MIRLDPRRILAGLLAFDLLLLAAYLLCAYGNAPWRLRALFDMNRDLSLPAWWSASQLAAAGLLALALGLVLRGRGGAGHGPRSPWKIFVLGGLGLVFLSADEAATIHEAISAAMYEALGHRWPIFVKPQRWDTLTALMYGAAGLALLWPVRRDVRPALRQRGALALIAGAAVFVIGAVFVDNLPFGAGSTLMYGLEDLCELTGASLILFSMLRGLEGRLVVHIVPSAIESTALRQTTTPSHAAAPKLAA